MAFSGFTIETLDFFADIRYHNEIAWFEANRDRYLRHVRDPFYALADELAPTVLEIDSAMDVRPVACVSRLRRDVRYARGKPPYRDHMWLGFRHRGVPKEQSFILYFDLYIESANVGLGCYGPQRDAMEMFREEITAHPRKFQRIIKPLQEHYLCDGDTYKKRKVPDTLPKSLHEWYLFKSLHVHRSVTKEALSPDLGRILAEDFVRLRDMYHYVSPFFAEAFGYGMDRGALRTPGKA